MALLKLSPAFKDYLWGGRRLAEDYNKEYTGRYLAESWELSCHPDGPCRVENGEYAGLTLPEYIKAAGQGVLGSNCSRYEDFPILIKFIDAKEPLSVQVHPGDVYAKEHEDQPGKTEVWYIMDCEPGAFLYYGFERPVSEEEFARRIADETLTEVLHKVEVQKGDVFFNEAGTLHAIGKGIVVAEIQQNSNVTYRVYDYGRVGTDGKKRQLHIDKALAVTDRHPVVLKENNGAHMVECDYFAIDKVSLSQGACMSSHAGAESFVSVLILDGGGRIACGGEELSFRKGDSLFVTAGSGDYEIYGCCEALVTRIP